MPMPIYQCAYSDIAVLSLFAEHNRRPVQYTRVYFLQTHTRAHRGTLSLCRYTGRVRVLMAERTRLSKEIIGK